MNYGKITRDDLFRIYDSLGYREIYTFDEFVERAIEEGTEIVNE